jgi:hypothetical protein
MFKRLKSNMSLCLPALLVATLRGLTTKGVKGNSFTQPLAYSALPEWGSDSNTDLDIFIEQVHYFEKCGIENCHGVNGRLAKHADYWIKMGALKV